jgi:hypothetical protein
MYDNINIELSKRCYSFQDNDHNNKIYSNIKYSHDNLSYYNNKNKYENGNGSHNNYYKNGRKFSDKNNDNYNYNNGYYYSPRNGKNRNKNNNYKYSYDNYSYYGDYNSNYHKQRNSLSMQEIIKNEILMIYLERNEGSCNLYSFVRDCTPYINKNEIEDYNNYNLNKYFLNFEKCSMFGLETNYYHEGKYIFLFINYR